MPDTPAPDREEILAQLDRVLASAGFRRADRSSALLRFVVERALDGDDERLKEYTLGAEALGRGVAFDPRTDPIVRAEASRLRERLARYYAADGADDPVVIALPKGSYVPRFAPRGDAMTTTTAGRRVGPPDRVVWGVAGAALALSIVAAVAWTRATRVRDMDGTPLRLEVELRSDGVLGSEVGPDVAVARDGTRLVFVARDSAGLAHLYTRRLDESAVARLAGTDGARVPFLSPDGRWVGFFADGALKKTPTDGGSPVVLCEATDVLGAAWGDDGTIVAALNPTGGLWRVPEAGGAPRVLVDLSAEHAQPVWPQILPGGAVLYTRHTRIDTDRADVEVYDPRTGTRRRVVRGGTYARWLPNGYLAYVNQGTLYAASFDVARLAVTGTAVPVLDDVAYSRAFGYAQLDVSPAGGGTLVYRRSAASGRFVVAWIDRAGRVSPLLDRPGRYAWPALSRDGRRLAVTSMDAGQGAILVHDAASGETRRLTGAAAEHGGLLWWSDATLLVGGRGGIASLRVDRAEAPRVLLPVSDVAVPWSVAPGGRLLAYYALHPGTGFDLWTAPLGGDSARAALGTPTSLLRTSAFEVYPAISPDGRWLAYGSNESGAWEIHVRRMGGGASVRVSPTGGRVPRWSPNGRELLYQTEDQRVFVTTFHVRGATFTVDPPRPWGGSGAPPLGDTGVLPGFDVAPDGERIAALLPAAAPAERQSPDHVTMVLNFLGAVRRRVDGARR
ncbi:WD40-like beta Propeller containing protein (plasmid) [Gemmatirosa kalamazoonensis]|uniref:WD40-like beta Propeller containing protein n=1 Tax=Gemmatirosa kalamazoonensis TaxID=861299 RepID=W0RRV5_9BACT|nr:PD40 domain-containing protein [Gemmatirosa kalamazoonensis]AHG93441.1 WD40-like beta Propeller containing protein [Gemmatirosa kalamazoonensis]